ncbi:insulinase family protein [Clostridium scatologenes]|uniref:Peptidase M16C associated domain protein n=1 Tax=Clostridium scatologenes TaxID=1548 RepID=A0A0E3JZY8_CLOSL|nr:insulinase family protein [Clostridium scatologenes]AKA68802.1 Peptidase M16C associated domain protein [Clostridium scatologenes]
MNKRLKSIIALTVITMMSSQAFIMELSNNVKAESSNVQVSSTINDSLGGFQLVSKKWIEDLKSNVCIYKHAKSGAQLIYLQNDSDNKMMCVNFRTPTKDNKGVNHVIEHSVLYGSKNYPVKDVLSEMAKQSLTTYLNAMTTGDSTLYPVASKNDKDFQNLMGIYLDAVFYPNVLKDKRIFEQEGIRYELNSPKDDLTYNGVVYNEMKGNYSSPDWVLNRAVNQSLFPDTSYKYESGGVPDEMPNLTYEELLKTYNENYNPANSYFYLYGKMDIDKTLKFIGENYLNNFDKKNVNTELTLQKPFTESVEKTVEYSLPKGASTKNKSYLSLNYVIDKNTNKDVVDAFNFLQTLLGGIPSSPIKKALKDNGFGENVNVKFDFSGIQPVFSIIAQNVDENQKDKFKQVVNDSLKNIVQNGFDDQLLNSIYKVYELNNRMVKGDYALAYDVLIMMSWMHGGDPIAYLNVDSDIANIKEKVKPEHFKELIKTYLLDNKSSSLVVLKPVTGLENKKEAELKSKLAAYKASLSKDQLNSLVKSTQDLKNWQNTPPTKEELNTLPTLTREDINTNTKEYKTVEKTESGVKVLEHPVYTNGIDFTTLYFDTSTVPQDKLGYVYLLSNVLGNIATKNYSKDDLREQTLINSGGITLYPECVVNHEDSNLYYPKMTVTLMPLNENLKNGFNILNEMIFNSNLNDKARLKEIISNLKIQREQQLAYNGNLLGKEKLLSYMSESGKYDAYKDDGFYSLLCDLDKNFNSKSDEIIKNLEQVRALVFNKKDLIVSFTGNEENYKTFADNLKYFLSDLKNENLKKYKYTFDDSTINEGLIIPSTVQYVYKGGDLKKTRYIENGKFKVLENILNMDYLSPIIRERDGAYGAYMGVDNSKVVFSSYRDPNLQKTIDTFNQTPEFLKNFNADEKQMTNYIIGTIGQEDNKYSKLDQYYGAAADGIIADNLYLTGTKQSDLEQERKDIISTTAEDIRNFAPVMDAVLKQNYLCVVGGETKIEESKKNFMTIKNILTSKEEKGNVINMEKKENVSSNKTWTFKFAKDLDEVTVNTANVYVLNDKNQQVKVNVSYDKNNKAIKVAPADSYEKGKKYTIFIKDIQSVQKDKTSSKLIAPVNMEFVIEK